MKTQYKLVLYSTLASNLCSLKLFKEPKKALFDMVVHKLAKLLYLANQRCVYSYVELLNVKNLISNEVSILSVEIEKYQKAIESKGVDMNFIINTPVYEKDVQAESPLIFDFVMLIQKFDKLMMSMYLARSAGVFTQQNIFLKLINKRKQSLQRLLSKIVQISTIKMPKVSISDYLHGDAKYRQAAETYGPIDPGALYNAAMLASTPLMQSKEMNQLKHALKKISSGVI